MKKAIVIGMLTVLPLPGSADTSSAAQCGAKESTCKCAERRTDPISGKPAMIRCDDLVTWFRYDNRGNLTHIENSAGSSIDLEYDGESQQITRMITADSADESRRELTFLYNSGGKPSMIGLVGVGEITVEYDPQGEIAKVNSDQGIKIALQVARVFMNLNATLKAAGVSF